MNNNNINPLLSRSVLPQFDKIEVCHVEPAVESLVAEAKEIFTRVENSVIQDWDNIMEPLQDINWLFERVWGPIAHLNGVKNSPELREVYEKVLPGLVEFQTGMGQSKAIYNALKNIKAGPQWVQMSNARRRSVEKRILAAEMCGVGLGEEDRKRFNEIEQKLSRLGMKFSNNILDSTKAFSLDLTEKEQIEGLTSTFLELASQSWNRANPDAGSLSTPENGPWRITIDGPGYIGFMQFAKNRELRHKVFMAGITIASSNDFDNTGMIPQIISLFQEKASLLGYRSYAHMSTAEKMSGSPDAVNNLYSQIVDPARQAAQSDINELEEFARRNGQVESLEPWDYGYWAKRMEEKILGYKDDDLRPYLPEPRILDGLFQLAEKLFDITVESADGQAPVWNSDVRYFILKNSSGTPIAAFYYDPYSRPENKRGGAWMDNCVTKCIFNGESLLPVAYICTNATPPAGNKPSLMTMNEVTTLFHEFGHALQHMLSSVDVSDVSGINGIEWDAVELASTFMENWCYHLPTLLDMARHYETGETMPEELARKIVAGKTFRVGSMVTRQILLGKFDLELFTYFPDNGTQNPVEFFHRLAREILVTKVCPEDKFPCAFAHIFAGGYTAGYYSYIWSDVLSSDAFAAFEEAGLDNEDAIKKTGIRYRDTILSLGGSKHPREVFREFRGREQNISAFLRHRNFQ